MTRRGMKRARTLRYEFAVKPPGTNDTILCGSLNEALFFARKGAQALVRETEIKTGEWMSVPAGEPMRGGGRPLIHTDTQLPEDN